MLSAVEVETREDRRERMLVHAIAWIERQGMASILEVQDDENSSELMNELKERLLSNLAGENPREAAALAMAHGDAFEAVLTTWANRDLSQAIAWLEELPEGDARRRATISLSSEAIRTDPRSALRLAAGLPPSTEREDLLNRATSEWVNIAPAEALAWVQQIDDPSTRSQLLAVAATALGEQDSAAAAQLALTSIEPGRAQNDAVVAIVQRWAQHDAASAAAWVAQFPVGELRDAAIENLVKLWPSSTEAANWLKGLPSGSGRDAGLRAYAEQIAPLHPGEAADWAAGITNPQMQASQLERIVRNWMNSDSATASRWVRSASLTPNIRQRLLTAHN